MKLSDVPFGIARDGKKYLTTIQLLQNSELMQWYVQFQDCFEYWINAESDRCVFDQAKYEAANETARSVPSQHGEDQHD